MPGGVQESVLRDAKLKFFFNRVFTLYIMYAQCRDLLQSENCFFVIIHCSSHTCMFLL